MGCFQEDCKTDLSAGEQVLIVIESKSGPMKTLRYFSLLGFHYGIKCGVMELTRMREEEKG